MVWRPLDLSLKKGETIDKDKENKEKKANTMVTLGDLFDEAVENTLKNEEFMKYAATLRR